MAQREISAGDILLMIDPLGGTAYSTIVCLTDLQFERSRNKTETTTKCGVKVKFGPLLRNLTFSGVLIATPNANEVSWAGLADLIEGNDTIGWKIAPVTPQVGDVIKTGTGTLGKFTESFPAEGEATFDGEISVNTDTFTEIVHTV